MVWLHGKGLVIRVSVGSHPCDLLELNIFQLEENSWLVLGTRARAGLRRVFTSVVTREEELHYTNLLVRILLYCFKTLEEHHQHQALRSLSLPAPLWTLSEV